MSDKNRNAELAKIHIGRKQLGMDQATYEAMLWTQARVKSSADLDSYGRHKVLQYMRDCGVVFTRKKRTKPALTKHDYIQKIKAFLAEADRPDEYADAIAKRSFHVDRYEWLQVEQLKKLIQMLAVDANRHNRRVK